MDIYITAFVGIIVCQYSICNLASKNGTSEYIKIALTSKAYVGSFYASSLPIIASYWKYSINFSEKL